MATGRNNRERGNGGKVKKRSITFACIEEEEMGTREEEIPENEVNVAYIHIHLANVLGGNDWGRKNWEKECSSITDACFNGGCLCSFSRLNRYEVYLRSFYLKSKLLKNENA